MPVISRFFGIVIRMYYNDHQPPHFHACYGEDESVVRVDPVGLLYGDLSPRSAAMVCEWALLHEVELIENLATGSCGSVLEFD
jgi:hypothetical protein